MVSLSATMGQLRGLTLLGLIPTIRYNSAVSGGARAAIVYTYYRRGAQTDAELLGPATPPERIDWPGLDDLPSSRLGILGTRDANALTFQLNLMGVPNDRLWITACGLLYLASFGLYDPHDPAFFALDEANVADIKQRNPCLRQATFYTVRSGAPRPYLIAHGCFVVPAALSPFKHYQLIDTQYTPLYVGTPHALRVDYQSLSGESREVLTGGGFVESFAFGSKAPAQPAANGFVEVDAPARPFDLADVSGTATASYAALYHNFFGDFSPKQIYWPVVPRGVPDSTLFNFGDGGNLEDYGLIALLQRRVENAVVFINTSTKLSLSYDPDQPPTLDDIDSNLGPLFGYPNYIQPNNQVFPTAEWAPLVRTLQRCKEAGRTLLAVQQLPVLDNDWWGIRGGWTVRVCWVYNDRVLDWEHLLNEATGIPEAIRQGNSKDPSGPFQNFPCYAVTGQNQAGSLALTPAQINLLADLSCWNVTSNAEVMTSVLTGNADVR